jgi:hypothetical protein
MWWFVQDSKMTPARTQGGPGGPPFAGIDVSRDFHLD